MGGGTYSSSRRLMNTTTNKGYAAYDSVNRSVQDNFKAKDINESMNPMDVKIREARDSEEHPNSVPIILALDVTGSMGSIPQHLVQEGLPHIMESLIKEGIADPQLLFCAIGDHECDRRPLQVAQFESNDELLDKWLSDVYLEGGGGGNDGESYLLAHYFAAYHTVHDAMEKRKQKGFLFTVGDEPNLRAVPAHQLKKIMGDGQYEDYSAGQLIDKAREIYNVYHLNICEAYRGKSEKTQNSWKELLGDNLINIQDHKDVSKVIVETVIKDVGHSTVSKQSDSDEEPAEETL